MTAGLIQLVAYGIEDDYLTKDPQITFFKIIYRRHTNFSIESVTQSFSQPSVKFGNKVSCTISRVGDLLSSVYLYVKLPQISPFTLSDSSLQYNSLDPIKKFAWVRNLGFALIKEVTLEIGDRLIDKQYGEWLYIWEQLNGKKINRIDGIDKMIGNIPEMYEFSNGKKEYELYIPLKFWFCKNIGLSIPLIALSATQVKISVTFREFEECCVIGPTHSIDILEDIVPFTLGDYIEQTINNESIYGYFMGYDYLTKQMYYIKIQDQNAVNKDFLSLQDTSATNSLQILENIAYQPNILYRIYNSLTGSYCTPKPNIFEKIIPTTSFFTINKPNIVESFLYVNYVYLENEERLKFARSNHEYLIDVIQFNERNGIDSPNYTMNITLNDPCKSHYWIVQMDKLVGARTINDRFNFTDSHIRYKNGDFYGKNIFKSGKLTLNGVDRFSERDSDYFNYVSPYQYQKRGCIEGINMYSFCINPEEHQPSGSCNMTQVDDIRIRMRLSNKINTQNTCKIRSYTISYNVLRIFYGLGGLAYVSGS